VIILFNNNNSEKLSKEATLSNLSSEVVEAISYGLVKGKKIVDFHVQNSQDKPSQFVEKMPPKLPIGGGEAVFIDEVRIIICNCNKIKIINF